MGRFLKCAVAGIRFAVLLLLPGVAMCQAADPVLDKARRITGYMPLKTDNDHTPRWDSLDVRNTRYAGPMRCEPGKWFRARPGRPKMIVTQEDLERWVYDMALSLEEEDKLKLAPGVTLDAVHKWVRKINTSAYGLVSVEEDKKGGCDLHISYTPEARILAAFRNDRMIRKLKRNERAVLEVCAWWIGENISIGMPNCQKLQKVHDVLVDTSAYAPGQHDTVTMLQQGRGSSVAYARTTQLLLHMLKLDCRIVYGTPEMNHVWNLVEVDGSWYHLDVCWDDPVAAAPLRTYHYYLLTDVEMDCDHDWVNPELYPETPQMNSRHFHMRHHTRHGCLAAASGYTLPREKEHILPALYNTYVKSLGGRSDMVANMLGVELNRDADAEALFLVDPRKEGKEKDMDKLREQPDKKALQVQNLHRLPVRPARISEQEKKKAIRDAGTFNKVLREQVSVLTSPRLLFQCAEEVEDWRMREMVGLSDINKYAECFNAVYDNQRKTISIDIKYWDYMRILLATWNTEAARKLTIPEGALQKLCLGRASKLRKLRSAEEKAVLVHSYCYKGLSPQIITEPFKQALEGVRYFNSLGRAQVAYVILNMAGVPTEIVHGRVKCREESWCISRVNQKDWFHNDYFPYCAGQHILPCCLRKNDLYILMCDDEIRKDHIWDPEGLPVTPTSVEMDVRKSLEDMLIKNPKGLFR